MKRSLAIAKVAHSRVVARDTVIMGFALENESDFRAGQFAMIHPLVPGMLLGRPFSILSWQDGTLDILVKKVGAGSAALMAMKPGDEVRIFGPLGQPFQAPALRERPAILVAGGVGVVPLHRLARELRSNRGPVPLSLFGAQTPADLPMELFDDESGPWQLWVEREAAADQREGRVTLGLIEALDQNPNAVVATCGPTPMMKAVAQICREREVPLWVCLEEQMGCGAGVCRACIIPSADRSRQCTVCLEGPVFSLDEISFLEEVRT